MRHVLWLRKDDGFAYLNDDYEYKTAFYRAGYMIDAYDSIREAKRAINRYSDIDAIILDLHLKKGKDWMKTSIGDPDHLQYFIGLDLLLEWAKDESSFGGIKFDPRKIIIFTNQYTNSKVERHGSVFYDRSVTESLGMLGIDVSRAFINKSAVARHDLFNIVDKLINENEALA